MIDHLFAPIPSTAELLMKTKAPARRRSTVDKIELVAFFVLALVAVLLLIVAGLVGFELISDATAKFLILVLICSIVITALTWAISQIVDLFLSLKSGFRIAALQIDEGIRRDQDTITEWARCDPAQLRERSKLFDLRVKLLTRRTNMTTVFTAIGVLVINLQDAGEKAALWGKLQAIPPFVLSGSLGILLGTLAVIVYTGRIERISGLLALAADRIESDKKQS